MVCRDNSSNKNCSTDKYSSSSTTSYNSAGLVARVVVVVLLALIGVLEIVVV